LACATGRRPSPSSRTRTARPSRSATWTPGTRARSGRATSWRRTAIGARCARSWESPCGYGQLWRSITIYFRADCAELLRDRNQGVFYVHNPQLRGFFRLDRMGGNGFLVINTVGEDVTQLGGRRAGGIDPGVSAGVPARGDRGRHADGGRRHRPLAGRGELRRAPPSGPSVPRGRRRGRRTAQRGFGGNAGVQDAHNRAWKLVAVVKGDAGQGLRDTYDAERLPLSEPTVR
jgi:hypothetical protein